MRTTLSLFVKVSVFIAVVLLVVFFNSCKPDEPVIELPVATLESVTNVTSGAASYSCIVSGIDLISCGVCWDTIVFPKITNSKTDDGNSNGNYTGQITGLLSETTYYVRAYATNSSGTTYSNSITIDTYTSSFAGILTDVEGNEYELISIGDQIWTSENLRTTKYNDGANIPIVSDSLQWVNLTTGAMCYYDNNFDDNSSVNGALYNFFVIETDMLCPDGYHVPTSQEWTVMENYLINNGYNYDGSISGNKIAKSLASAEGWLEDGEIGNVGNNQIGNNSTEFNAYPAGIRSGTAAFLSIDANACFWTSTSINSTYCYNKDIFHTSPEVFLNENLKSEGFSVRCVND